MEMIFSEKLRGKIVKKDDLDQITFNLTGEDFYKELELCGSIPLPPYMKRSAHEVDKENYQTVLAEIPGAVAAPTAGLHFSEEFLSSLQQKGIDITTITLEVGGGTFLPVTSETLAGHKMHSENYWISQEAADKIKEAKKDKRRVIAVGTTSARTLEAGAIFCQGELFPHSKETDLFIQPGFQFKIIDGLITNFHLPKSTLFVLVASYVKSLEKAQELYNYAIEEKYRFFSYGDACFFTQENG
jgi:S-adenosylmethionine:tRNA ribosyltransferase-isomerase